VSISEQEGPPYWWRRIDHKGPTPEAVALGKERSVATKQRKAQERQAEAVRLSALGWRVYRIAAKLQVTQETVRVYLREAQATTTNGSGGES
jgi:DNA-binding NarL/FixJ family response regulator